VRGQWSFRDAHRRAGAHRELRGVYVGSVTRAAADEVLAVVRAGTPTHSRLRDRLVAVAVTTAGVDLICAVLALIFEHGGKQSQVTSFGSAIFWSSTQLLTVSSSIQNPVTTPGRVLDVFMELYAITVVATLAGSLGAFLVKRGEELEHAARLATRHD
jgi:hypothetical protein